MKRGKRKSSWSCESVFPDCLARYDDLILRGDVNWAERLENRLSSPASPTAAVTCTAPARHPRLLPSSIHRPPQPSLNPTQAAPAETQSPVLLPVPLTRVNKPQISISSCQLFILENSLCKISVMHTDLEGGEGIRVLCMPGSEVSAHLQALISS